jgi:hypothetical protein
MANIRVGHTRNSDQKPYNPHQIAPLQTPRQNEVYTTNKHTDNELLGQIRPTFCQNAYEEFGAQEVQFVIYRAA